MLFLLIAVGGGIGWYQVARNARGKGGPELVLKSTDKAVTTRSWTGESVADEGAAVVAGTTLNTRNSQKTVFRFGASASLRAASKTEFIFSSTETTVDGGARKTFATLDLLHGRLWLVGGEDVAWIVRTPSAVVRTDGRITEVELADNGTCSVAVWQGKAELTPVKHPDRAVTVGELQQASFSGNTMENPHPRGLSEEDKKDAWLAANLKETMGKEINEKPVSPSPQGPQK